MSESTCSPLVPGRVRGPVAPTGRVFLGSERHLVGLSNGDQLNKLFTVLRGAGCDFDDCWVATAEAFGLNPSEHSDLFELLGAASELLAAQDWTVLRRVAVDVFFDLRDDDMPVPFNDWDRRSFDERVDDALFDGHGCRVCAAFPEVPTEDHRELAGVVASGRLTWERVTEVVETKRADR